MYSDSVMFKQSVCKIPPTHCCVFKGLRDFNSQCTFESGLGGALCHITPGGPEGYVTGGEHPSPLPGPSPKYNLTNLTNINNLKVTGMQVSK